MKRRKKKKYEHAVDKLLENPDRFQITEQEKKLFEKIKEYNIIERYWPNPHNAHLIRADTHRWYMTAGPWWDLHGPCRSDRREQVQLRCQSVPDFIYGLTNSDLKEYPFEDFLEVIRSKSFHFQDFNDEELLFVLHGGRFPLNDVAKRIRSNFNEPFQFLGGAGRGLSKSELYTMAQVVGFDHNYSDGYLLGRAKQIDINQQAFPIIYCYRDDVE